MEYILQNRTLVLDEELKVFFLYSIIFMLYGLLHIYMQGLRVILAIPIKYVTT